MITRLDNVTVAKVLDGTESDFVSRSMRIIKLISWILYPRLFFGDRDAFSLWIAEGM